MKSFGKIYSIVTDHYRPSPSRCATGYPLNLDMALHYCNGTKRALGKVQVRSERMDEIAEKDMQHITNIKWRRQEGGLMFG
jgi:GTP pyrophosphokinase